MQKCDGCPLLSFKQQPYGPIPSVVIGGRGSAGGGGEKKEEEEEEEGGRVYGHGKNKDS